MKKQVILDPPFEVHKKVGIVREHGTDEQGRRTTKMSGGCDYVSVTIECDNPEGVEWLLNLVKDRIVTIYDENP